MTLFPAYPQGLTGCQAVFVRFNLELLSPCVLELNHLLSLRRPLMRAARLLPADRCAALFAPPLSDDPVALRRYQKPAPPFVLRSVQTLAGRHLEGDCLPLEVLFLGSGTLLIGDFLKVLQALGMSGLVQGVGIFELRSAQCRGGDGQWRTFWQEQRIINDLAPDMVRLDQWLESNWPANQSVLLNLTTPARLVAGGRVLRRPRFDQLFPFMLRRVSSMLHAHCAVELVDEPDVLLDAARQVSSEWRSCQWIDWRELGGGEESADNVGGLVGCLRLGGAGLDELLWVLLLASLFGAGKGAAYGAGGFRSEDFCS